MGVLGYTFENNVLGTLGVDITDSAVSLVFTYTPSPNRGPPVVEPRTRGILTLTDSLTNPTKIEIITYSGVTPFGGNAAITGVVRACEGTSAYAWPAGTYIFQSITAGALNDDTFFKTWPAGAISIGKPDAGWGSAPADDVLEIDRIVRSLRGVLDLCYTATSGIRTGEVATGGMHVVFDTTPAEQPTAVIDVGPQTALQARLDEDSNNVSFGFGYEYTQNPPLERCSFDGRTSATGYSLDPRESTYSLTTNGQTASMDIKASSAVSITLSGSPAGVVIALGNTPALKTWVTVHIANNTAVASTALTWATNIKGTKPATIAQNTRVLIHGFWDGANLICQPAVVYS